MTLTQEQILEYRKKYGITPVYAPTPATKQDNRSGFIQRVGEDLKKRGASIAQTFKDTAEGKINPLETGIQTVGAVAGGVNDLIAEGVKSGVNALPQGVKDTAKNIGVGILQTPVGQAGVSAIQQGAEKYNQWKVQNPQGAKDLESVLNIAALFPVGKAGQVAKGGVEQVGRKTVSNVVTALSETAPNYAKKASSLLASDPMDQVKTILQETPRSVFDDYVNIAKEAAIDPRKPSVFEKVGDNIVEATKQLKNQADSLASQKAGIINQAKIGLQPFTEAPRKAIIKVMKLQDNPLKAKVIQDLKSIKTKLDADRVIDEIQADIYNAAGTNLIAKGSTVEKQLRGIVGEMNAKLKEELPMAYKTLNAKYANRIQVVNTLNRALGEMVDGVATRGAGLIKQFFSPSGTKTKELFSFIKKNTGVDLAQDTTVAKFMGELFDDPKVKSLLEGVPTTKSGYMQAGIDFMVDKTGLGKGMQSVIRKGTLEKARKLTK